MEVLGTNRNSNWLANLLRLLTLRGAQHPAGDAAVAVCAAVALATWVLVDRLQWGAGVEFDSFGISMLALVALLVLALAYLGARLCAPPLPVRRTIEDSTIFFFATKILHQVVGCVQSQPSLYTISGPSLQLSSESREFHLKSRTCICSTARSFEGVQISNRSRSGLGLYPLALPRIVLSNRRWR